MSTSLTISSVLLIALSIFLVIAGIQIYHYLSCWFTNDFESKLQTMEINTLVILNTAETFHEVDIIVQNCTQWHLFQDDTFLHCILIFCIPFCICSLVFLFTPTMSFGIFFSSLILSEFGMAALFSTCVQYFLEYKISNGLRNAAKLLDDINADLRKKKICPLQSHFYHFSSKATQIY